MNITALVNRSADIITQYYQNNITPFLEAFHDDALWIGPAEKQILRTRDSIREAFAQEEHSLHFILHDLTLIPLTVGSRHACEIMAFYRVDTIGPDGSSNQVIQRVQLTWCLQNGEPRIRVCHISNAISYDERDNIYPVHYAETFRTMTLAGETRSERLSFRGMDKSLVYLNLAHIIYIETNGRHTTVHTIDGNYASLDSLPAIEKRYPHYLVRSHQSYLVNPEHVIQLRRFQVQLTGGVTLPIPEKKYTAVKAKLVK